jgi:hypothetical protein
MRIRQQRKGFEGYRLTVESTLRAWTHKDGLAITLLAARPIMRLRNFHTLAFGKNLNRVGDRYILSFDQSEREARRAVAAPRGRCSGGRSLSKRGGPELGGKGGPTRTNLGTGLWPSLVARHGAGPQSDGHHGFQRLWKSGQHAFDAVRCIIPAKPHGWSGLALTAFENLSARDQARSKRSAFITLVHAATKSATNFACASSAP